MDADRFRARVDEQPDKIAINSLLPGNISASNLGTRGARPATTIANGRFRRPRPARALIGYIFSCALDRLDDQSDHGHGRRQHGTRTPARWASEPLLDGRRCSTRRPAADQRVRPRAHELLRRRGQHLAAQRRRPLAQLDGDRADELRPRGGRVLRQHPRRRHAHDAQRAWATTRSTTRRRVTSSTASAPSGGSGDDVQLRVRRRVLDGVHDDRR